MSTLRLLILEDDLYDAELEVAILHEAGYVCEWERIENREEFLTRLDKPDYDLILADYNLPAFDGLTALKLFRARNLDLPFVLVSGSLGEEIAIESLKAGATDYVLKDRLSRLGPVVRRALAEKEEQRQRKNAEDELRRRNRELALLNQASQALSSTLDLDQVLVTILGEVRRLFGAVASSVWLINPETGELVCQEAAGPHSEVVRGWRLAPGEGLAGWVAQQDRQLIVADTWEDERYFAGVEQEIRLSLRSVLGVPMRVKQKVIGVLQVVDSKPDSFGPTDLTLVESLAATAAIAIENARLFSMEVQRAVLLARTLEKQRELDRLKSEFIQNVSHELRTPLAITLGYAELLESGELGELQPDQRNPVAIIARRMRMLRKLVDDINAILEIETQGVRREPVDVAALVNEALVDFREVTDDHGLTLEAEITPGDYQILGDHVQLCRMLDNLLGNALKFTPEGGQITVRVEQDEEKVVLKIADTGIGIPPHELRRVFDRFYQIDGSTTRRFGGAGLGLALVKDIVDAHGGMITVRSQVNEGSTFRVMLPFR